MLIKHLTSLIKINGPITVHEFMKTAIRSSLGGFYMNQDVFGSRGHFTTSPEVSQIFGELIAVWIISEWQRVNCPTPLRIIELGPGRGTLAVDVSRVLSQIPITSRSSAISLIEVSPKLKQIQAKNLTGHEMKPEENETLVSKFGIPVSWHYSLETLPKSTSGFDAFVANEFFDALPVHKFHKTQNNKWCELMVDIDNNHPGKFKFIQTPGETPASKALITQESRKDLKHLEVCPEAGIICKQISDRLNDNQTGCFLTCDYGFGKSEGSLIDRDTLRGYYKHEQVDPLINPGEIDLTADVDFAYLESVIKNQSVCFGPVTQEHFLTQVGIGLRLSKLLESTKDAQVRKTLITGVEMLLTQMGQKFKFWSFFPNHFSKYDNTSTPAGFM